MNLLDRRTECEGQEQLFDPIAIDPGLYTFGLPSDVESWVQVEARSAMYKMPRYSRYDVRGDGEVDVLFIPERNLWIETMGAMGISMTPLEIALSAAQRCLYERIGVAYRRFEAEAKDIAEVLAAEYEESYPRTVAVNG